jgi:hypothetical protein
MGIDIPGAEGIGDGGHGKIRAGGYTHGEALALLAPVLGVEDPASIDAFVIVVTDSGGEVDLVTSANLCHGDTTQVLLRAAAATAGATHDELTRAGTRLAPLDRTWEGHGAQAPPDGPGAGPSPGS